MAPPMRPRLRPPNPRSDTARPPSRGPGCHVGEPGRGACGWGRSRPGSDRHPGSWPRAPNRDDPRRDWYVWHDPKWRDPKPDGSPPNNWRSVFLAVSGPGLSIRGPVDGPRDEPVQADHGVGRLPQSRIGVRVRPAPMISGDGDPEDRVAGRPGPADPRLSSPVSDASAARPRRDRPPTARRERP